MKMTENCLVIHLDSDDLKKGVKRWTRPHLSDFVFTTDQLRDIYRAEVIIYTAPTGKRCILKWRTS